MVAEPKAPLAPKVDNNEVVPAKVAAPPYVETATKQGFYGDKPESHDATYAANGRIEQR